MVSAEFYSNCSSKKRPEKKFSAGFGDYCCIPECESAFYTKRDGKTSLFRKIAWKREDG